MAGCVYGVCKQCREWHIYGDEIKRLCYPCARRPVPDLLPVAEPGPKRGLAEQVAAQMRPRLTPGRR